MSFLNGFVAIHWIAMCFNEFSCKYVHWKGNNDIVFLSVLLHSASVECMLKHKDRVFSTGKGN